MAGIYIHVPFCKSKCIYCDFYSVTDCSRQGAFVSRIIEELKERRDELPPGEPVRTIYFGGGTPSLLSAQEVERMLSAIRENYLLTFPDVEITLECNPGDLTHVEAEELVRTGINRVSIGAQSFNPTALKFLTRRHTPLETAEMVRLFRRAGIRNITLDLIYGIPHTTIEDLLKDLESLVSLDPEHVSAYSLMYEEGTPLHRSLLARKVTETDEDTVLEMSHLVRGFLRDHGYEQYEISNFRRIDPVTDYRSQHNSSYWDGTPYLGFGPGAHSYVDPVRSWNVSDLELYLTGAPRKSETLTREMKLEEYLLTRLRTSTGIDLDKIKALSASDDAYRTFLDRASEMTLGEEPLLTQSPCGYRLTDRGIDLSDSVILRLAED